MIPVTKSVTLLTSHLRITYKKTFTIDTRHTFSETVPALPARKIPTIRGKNVNAANMFVTDLTTPPLFRPARPPQPAE